MKPHLIGLSGFARSGKSTVGQYLADRHGYEQRAFADKLRELAAEVDPEYRVAVEGRGYENAKQSFPFVRELLVAVGAGTRKVLGPDVWVDALLPRPVAQTGTLPDLWNRWPGAPTVITDVRYANEAIRIKQLGGELWHIDRLYIQAANEEEARSIALLPRADRYIHNMGGLDALEQEVERALHSYQ